MSRLEPRSILFSLPLILLGACQSPPMQEDEVLLIDRLEDAEVVVESPQPVVGPEFEIDHDRRTVITQHAPSKLRFSDMPSEPGTFLHLAPMLDPRAWNTPSDGVTFEVACQRGEEWLPLLELHIDPVHEEADRRWHDRILGLEPCGSPTTTLELSTSCGESGNCAADWAAWGHPVVRWKREFETQIPRLALLISIDTLRPDHLEIHGGRAGTSPALATLARDAVVFENAVASTPWTIPSHATMLSSSYPSVHGANAQTPIPEALTLLPEVFEDQGWQTAAWVDTPYLSRKFGFQQGFEHFDDEDPTPGNYRRKAPFLRNRLIQRIAAADERPAFFFWHIMDVHGPYGASAPFGGNFRAEAASDPAPFKSLWERLPKLAYHEYLRLSRYRSLDDIRAGYDEGIAAVDHEIGRLFDLLRALDLYEDALIVVTSDHGESFLDHGVWVGHGLFATEDEIRVPLIVKLPGNRFAGRRVDGMVGLVDVAPSILDALEMDVPKSFQGQSLVSPSPGAPGSLPRVVFGLSTNLDMPYLRTNEFKYIGASQRSAEHVVNKVLRAEEGVDVDLGNLLAEQLYDLRKDPTEKNSDLGSEPETLERFRQLIAQHQEDSRARREALDTLAQGEAELSEEALERLRALGYVD